MAKIIKRTKKIKRKHYSKDEKNQVISKLLSPGCTVEEVAKSTDISRSTLHEWKRAALNIANSKLGLQQQEGLSSSKLKNISDLSAKFVEVSVAESCKSSVYNEMNGEGVNFNENDNYRNKGLNLSEALLIFEDFSLNIKGRLSSSRLIVMLDLLARE